jgi:hypothetical protein
MYISWFSNRSFIALQQECQRSIHPFEPFKKAGAKSGPAGIAGGWENTEERGTILDRSPRRTIYP